MAENVSKVLRVLIEEDLKFLPREVLTIILFSLKMAGQRTWHNEQPSYQLILRNGQHSFLF